MPKNKRPATYEVLIFEDNEKMAENLKSAFMRFNNGALRAPLCEKLHTEIQFQVQVRMVKDADDALRFHSAYDVIIIDRMVGAKEETDITLPVLRLLHHLSKPSVRIIWTGHPEEENMLACMQLGAWDYIDKAKQKHGVTFIDVVESTLAGLRWRAYDERKSVARIDGERFVFGLGPDWRHKCQGNWVAMARNAKGEWQRDPAACHKDLLALFQELDANGYPPEDYADIFITWIGEDQH